MLCVITKKMKADYGLLVDPCADVEAISTKGHRTYTFEQPNSLGVDELSSFFETAWEKYPQHFAVISARSPGYVPRVSTPCDGAGRRRT